MPKKTPQQTKILIIEDEEILLEVLQKKLIYEGYNIDTAEDGETGLEKIKKFMPDLILLDIILPKLDGFGILEILHQDQKLSSIPIIIISNSGQPVEIDRAIRLGAKDYLVKTEFDPMEVIEKVKNLLGHNKQTCSNNKTKILIIEDDQFLRELCEKKLQKEGFIVSTAADGESGFKKIVEEKPNLILLDIVLPSMDGFEVLKRVRKNPDMEIATIPIIVLSNLGQDNDLEKAKKLGVNNYLVKAHFTTDEIAEKIKKALKK